MGLQMQTVAAYFKLVFLSMDEHNPRSKRGYSEPK